MLLEVGETMGGEEEKVDEERRWEWTRRGLSAQLEVPALMGRARHVDAMHLPRGSHASTTRRVNTQRDWVGRSFTLTQSPDQSFGSGAHHGSCRQPSKL